MKRGQIYFIQRRDTLGAEITKARPAIVVSHNTLNATSGVVEVVYLTTQPKKELHTHVTIEATGITSTALCEQIDTVSVRLVGDLCGTCSDEEMAAIDKALRISLCLEAHGSIVMTENSITLSGCQNAADFIEEIERLTTERDRYARMIDLLLQEREGRA